MADAAKSSVEAIDVHSLSTTAEVVAAYAARSASNEAF